jgi:hypothetical protein
MKKIRREEFTAHVPQRAAQGQDNATDKGKYSMYDEDR